MDLLNRLARIQLEWEENQDAIGALATYKFDLELTRDKLMNEMVLASNPELEGVDLEHDTTLRWGCDKSPTGLCVYNKKEDPMQDQCLCCDAPNERK